MTGRWPALAAMLAGAAAAAAPLRVGGRSIALGQRRAATTVRVQGHGHTEEIVLPPDQGIYAHSLESGEVTGAIGERVLIVTVTYASNPRGGSHQCGAGEETELRVLALGPLRQTFHRRVDSCWTDLENQALWDARTLRLTIEAIPEGAGEGPPPVFAIAPDGAVTPVSAR